MTWVRFDDQTDDHPKIAGLSDSAFRWWFRGFCYSGRYLLDGVLPHAFLVRVPKKASKELIDAGLWEYKGEILMVHDYHDYQPTKASVTAKRQKTADRLKRFRNAVTGKQVTPLVTSEFPAACSTPDPDPSTNTPLTPLRGDFVVERDPTRAELDWGNQIFRAHGCTHEHKCDDQYTCVGKMIGDRRRNIRDGIREAAAS